MKIPTGLPGDVLLVDGGPWWKSPISGLIRWRTNSDWSHVGMLIDCLTAARLRRSGPHAKFIHLGAPNEMHVAEALPSGFQIRPASVYKDNPWRVRTWTDPLSDHEWSKAVEVIESFLGRAYDWPGVILGFGLRDKHIGENNKLFCSEALRMIVAAMPRLISDDNPDSLTPPAWFAAAPTPPLQTTDWHIRKPLGWP